MALTKVTQHSLGNSAVSSAKLNLTTLSAGNTTLTGSLTVSNNGLRITKTGTYPGGLVFGHNDSNNIASLSIRDSSDTSYNTLYLEPKEIYIKCNAASNDLYISNTEMTTIRRFKAPSLVSSGGYGNNTPHGYYNYTDGSSSVSIPSNATKVTLGSTSFTIPSTSGISTWRVIVLASWTGQQPGGRLWTWLSLNDSGGNSNNGNPNSTGYSEHSWGESDLSVGAFSWNQHGVWENIAAGTHTLYIQANASAAGGSCWRRGAAIFWFPSS